MSWRRDETIVLTAVIGGLFLLGFLARGFGLAGFLFGAGLAFAVSRLLASWLRARYEIEPTSNEDKVDGALRSAGILDAVESHGRARAGV